MGISAVVLTLLGATLLAGPGATVVRGPLCAPEPAVGEVLAQLDQIEETCVDRAGCREAKRRLIEGALEKRPDDLFLHRASQDLVLNQSDVTPADRAAVEQSYKARLDRHPTDPLWLLLYARSVPYTRDGERLAAWTRAVTLDPTFAPAHFELVWLRQASATHKDQVQARVHAAAYAGLCPDALDLLGLPGDDDAGQAEHARRVRALLERRNDSRDLRRYTRLWSLEFKSTAPAEHDAVRARIRADLERLKAQRIEERPLWWSVLADGYGLIGDVPQQDELERARLQRFPCVVDAGWARLQRFEKAHPYPEGPDVEAWLARSRALYEASAEWVRQCPDSLTDWMERFQAAAGVNDLPNEEFGVVADRFLELWARPDRGMSSWPSPYLRAAHAYVDRSFRLERVDGLVRQGLVESEARQAEMEASAKTDERRKGLAGMRQTTLWNARTCQVRAALGLRRAAETAAAIDELEKLAREAAGPDARSDQWRRNQIASYRSQRAESEGRKLDALVLALDVLSEAPEPTKAQAQVDRLWKDLGGTDEGWEALKRLERPKAPAPQAVDTPSDWAAKDTPLADFDLVDLAGKRWTKKDLAGRTALLNVWSTTCGPCKWELPHLQKVHERIRDRDDVILLSLNVDENPGVIQPFLARQGYTFPVLLAADWIDRTLRGEYGIPMNWIVDRDGVLRYEAVGFGSAEGDKWADETFERLVSVAERRPVPY